MNQEKNVILLVALSFLAVFISAVVSATGHAPAKVPLAAEEGAPMEIAAEDPAPAAILLPAGSVAEAFVAPVDEAVAIIAETPAAELAEPSSVYVKTFLSNTIETCDMAEWGVSFKCDEKWVVQREAHPDQPEIEIYQDPRVVMSWKKLDANVRFLGQLNDLFFEKTSLYKEGFRTERVKFAGREAVLVKGLASEDPQTQRRDYFYLNGDKLVSISFAVSPEDKWDEGKLVIQEVKNTFSPLEN